MNGSVSLEPGNLVSVGGAVAQIVTVLDSARVEVSYGPGSYEQVGVSRLRPIPTRDNQPVRTGDMATPAERQAYERRRAAITPLFRGRPIEEARHLRISTAEWKKCAAAAGVCVLSLRTWFNRVRDSGTWWALVYPKRRCGKDKTRLPPPIEAIVQKHLERHLSDHEVVFSDLVEEIQSDCLALGYRVSASTIRRRFKKMPALLVIARTHGRQAAEYAARKPGPGFPELTHPLDLVMIDETPLDKFVTDYEWREAALRPHILAAISVSTLVVWSIVLCPGPARACDVAMLIRRGVFPKEEVLEEYLPDYYDPRKKIPWTEQSLEREWPVWGHANLHSDNGKIFRAAALEEYQTRYLQDRLFRPIQCPSSGPFIENILKQINFGQHRTPGTTKSNPDHRGDYKSEENACMTLEETMAQILLGLRRWHRTPKRSLGGLTPLGKLETDYRGYASDLGIMRPPRIVDPAQRRRMFISLLPKIHRTVQEYGIANDKYHYWSEELLPFKHFRQIGSKAQTLQCAFHEDFRDVLYVRLPDTDEYIDVHCVNLRERRRSDDLGRLAQHVSPDYQPMPLQDRVDVRRSVDYLSEKSRKSKKQLKAERRHQVREVGKALNRPPDRERFVAPRLVARQHLDDSSAGPQTHDTGIEVVPLETDRE